MLTVSEKRKLLARTRRRTIAYQTVQIRVMKYKGYANVAIANELGIPESTVRRRLSDVK